MAKNYRHLHEQVTSRGGAPERLAALRKETHREMALHEVREATGRSQSSLAATLGISQPAVSQVEGGSDLKISTLRAYLEALGARLEIVAVFGEADDEVAVPVDLNHRSSSGQGRALR